MLSLFATALLPALAFAQGQFGAAENSGAVLQALFVVDQTTVGSGQGAQAYQINNPTATQNLEDENAALLQAWQNVTTIAQSSDGFYSASGAQSLIDYVNDKVYPDTKYADSVYVQQRDSKSCRSVEKLLTGVLTSSPHSFHRRRFHRLHQPRPPDAPHRSRRRECGHPGQDAREVPDPARRRPVADPAGLRYHAGDPGVWIREVARTRT
ncbi:hypothetical protein Tdes44962_MAKER09746 [Teratosphaeria destructans]|uniref:Uncharacterized protein n=1 Tax=Teratosphaeria destructans TaxID=418781 RepID=A0A9W7SRP1_9PEZI|nr:hypothetical protein Tdes44962_MAKER09746 [Teratosphaeria destructans]